MANVDHISAGNVGVIENIRGVFASVSESFRMARQFRENYNELDRLSARELADIGLSRGDITRVAYEATYGEKSDFRAR